MYFKCPDTNIIFFFSLDIRCMLHFAKKNNYGLKLFKLNYQTIHVYKKYVQNKSTKKTHGKDFNIIELFCSQIDFK